MQALPEPNLPWTEHYVKYGFAVRRGVVGRAFCDRALKRVCERVGTNLPPQWTVHNVQRSGPKLTSPMGDDVLDAVYDQPGIRELIDEMFRPTAQWSGERMYQIFVNPFNPDAEPGLSRKGHIDFVDCPIPVLGSGCMFQVSLVETEPNGGNITIYPGTHVPVQKHVIDDPQWRYPRDAGDIAEVEPFEFVAEPGDVLFFHHLVFHAGNSCAGRTHRPRIALHCQALRDSWLESVDPADPDLSPWERSLARNGAYRPPMSEEQMMTAGYEARGRAAGAP